jgi:hypothetical protein
VTAKLRLSPAERFAWFSIGRICSMTAIPGEIHLYPEIPSCHKDIGKFCKYPMATGTNVVDSGNPASIHGGLFLPRILVLVSFDLHSKMEQMALGRI